MNLNVLDFARNYPKDREKIFRILNSCENANQLETAKLAFLSLRRKWGSVLEMNSTINLLFCEDENLYNQRVLELSSLYIVEFA